MSREIFLRTIRSILVFLRYSNSMIEKTIKKQSSEMQKDFKKSNLDILTEENDRLLKSLKRPSGSYRAA